MVEIGPVDLEKNNFKFTNVFLQFRNNLPLEKGWNLDLNKLEFSSPLMICIKFDSNWHIGSGKDDFSNLLMYFRNFEIISLWKRSGLFIWTSWTNLNPFHSTMHCAKFSWNWPSGSGEDDYLILSMYFRNFEVISPWKKSEPIMWAILNPLQP